MAKPHVKLSNSLAILHAIQKAGGPVIELAAHPPLTRVHRERLQEAGFLALVIPGWYIANRPDEGPGASTYWYATMDSFATAYATSRFKGRWQVSPEISLLRHSGETSALRQLVIHAPEANNQVLRLPHDCSLLLHRIKEDSLSANATTGAGGLRMLPLEEALIAVSPQFFKSQGLAGQIALRAADATQLNRLLLDGDHNTIGGRVAGGLRSVGRADAADEVIGAMRAAGHKVVEANPFDKELPNYPFQETEPPHVQRIRALWTAMRARVVEAFESVPRDDVTDIPAFLADIEARYVADAYHSLSIEGYQVTEELIERVRSGNWSADDSESERETKNAMAARGYFELHRHVRSLIESTLREQARPGGIVKRDLPAWYRLLFGPSVQAGIVPASSLAGYRSNPVYIRNARHVPPAPDWVRHCMSALLELLQAEDHPAVRAVLGHFIFVYIHPYMDGNGRIARFLMNFMLTTAGYRWTIVTVQSREEYMRVLDQASGDKEIEGFAEFLARMVREQHANPVARQTNVNDHAHARP